MNINLNLPGFDPLVKPFKFSARPRNQFTFAILGVENSHPYRQASAS
jgi:hypothetical protein